MNTVRILLLETISICDILKAAFIVIGGLFATSLFFIVYKSSNNRIKCAKKRKMIKRKVNEFKSAQSEIERYKFKGISEVSRKWIYGTGIAFYKKYNKKLNSYYYTTYIKGCQLSTDNGKILNGSLCQFIGLQDYYKNDIYENDVLTDGYDYYRVVFEEGQYMLLSDENTLLPDIADVVGELELVGNVADIYIEKSADGKSDREDEGK